MLNHITEIPEDYSDENKYPDGIDDPIVAQTTIITKFFYIYFLFKSNLPLTNPTCSSSKSSWLAKTTFSKVNSSSPASNK